MTIMEERNDSALAKMLEPLTNEILAYAKDARHNYAIGLEGEWGSGKTRYLETIAKPALKDAGFSMIRVSLFGVDSPEDLYGKIGSAFIRLDGEKSKGKEVAREALSQAPELAKNVLSAFGVNLSFTASMKTLVDVALRKGKHVLVFDDLERRQTDKNDLALFGAINDLVENKEIKTIIVSSSLSRNSKGSDGQGKSLDVDLREKIIWKVLHFHPDPDALVDDVLAISPNQTAGFDVCEVVKQAARSSQCRNARALLKAEKLVEQLCGAECLSDSKLSEDARKRALHDAASFCFLICMEKEPRKPEDVKPTGQITQELLEHISQRETYEKYCDLPILNRALKSISSIEDSEIDNCLREYIKRRFPDSPDTVALSKITHLLSVIANLRDIDIETAIPDFCEIVRRKNFSPTILESVISFNGQLSNIGFEGLLSEEELVECGKAVIANDPESGFFSFRERALAFGLTDKPCKECLAKLCDFALESYRDSISIHLRETLDISDDACGSKLAKSFEQARGRDISLLLAIDPDTVVKVFCNSCPEAQSDLRGFFINLKHFFIPNGEGTEPYVEWLAEIQLRLNNCKANEKLDGMRLGWFKSNIQDLLSYLKPAQSSGITSEPDEDAANNTD